MKTTLLKTQVLSALVAGTSRQPIEGIAGGDLNALSLAGQALRFEIPVSPPHFAVEPATADDRTLLPDALRRSLLRLVTGKLATEHAPLALANAFDRLRLRPHPFDLPRMENFARTYAEQLGTTAQHRARPRDAADEPSSSYFDDETLTDENWTHATLVRSAAYLAEQRRKSPAAARTLLEAAWPGFNPDARLRMLQTLEPTLEPSDRAFLETLDKDRAPRVRAFTLRLLARLGGTAENPALRELLPRIQKTQAGFLRRRPVLALELPATVKEQAAPMWIREAFADISFDELARALELSEDELIGAAEKDTRLLLGLALIATADRKLELLRQIASGPLPQAWELLEETGLRDLSLLSSSERLRWAEILSAPYRDKLPTAYLQWSWLHRMLRQPAPAQLIHTVLASGWLDRLDLEKQGSAWMELLAALCPTEQRAALRGRLTSLDSTHTGTALPLLDILDAMEKVRPHA